MNFIHSIKFRFTIWYLLVLAVLLCILGTSIYFFLSRGLYRNLDHNLELRAAQLQNIPTIISSIREGEFQEKLGEVVMLCYYSGGTLVAVSPRNASLPADYEFIERAITGKKSFDTITTKDGTSMRF